MSLKADAKPDPMDGAVTTLPSGLVVDKTKLDKLDTAAMTVFLQQRIYGQGKRVVLVDRPVVFFTAENLLKELDTGGPNADLILEKFEIALTADEQKTLSAGQALKKRILDTIAATKPAYEFAKVPEGWSVKGYIQVNGSTVSRSRTSPSGDGSGYSLGLKTVERLWNAASKYWAKTPSAEGQIEVRQYDGYGSATRRRARFANDSIQVDCQTIRRYELEQLALERGWAFP